MTDAALKELPARIAATYGGEVKGYRVDGASVAGQVCAVTVMMSGNVSVETAPGQAFSSDYLTPIVRATLGLPLGTPVADNDNQQPEDAPVDGLPVELCYPPGAVGDFARFIVAAARFPSPPLALAGALALTAALVGRRYKGPTGLRSNVYLVGLADSGHGKDITLRAPIAIAASTAAKSRVTDKFFIDDLASVQGLATKLRKDPSAVLQKDEFGKWLSGITGRRAPAHEAAIATAMLQLTGAPSGSWGGVEKAAGQLPRVYSPCFSIHGVTTPTTFWAALGDGNISEGFLGRLILFDAGNRMPTKVRQPAGSLEAIPPQLTDHVERLVGRELGGNLFGVTATGETEPSVVIGATYAPGVHDLFEDFDDRIRAEAPRTNPAYRPLLTRVGENSARLALIVAVGSNPAEPVITAEIQEWANAVAEHSYRTMARGAAENIAEGPRQLEYLKVRQLITRRGEAGLKQKDLIRQLRGRLDRRMCDEILAQLLAADEVIFGEAPSPSGQKLQRWWPAASQPVGFKALMRPQS